MFARLFPRTARGRTLTGVIVSVVAHLFALTVAAHSWQWSELPQDQFELSGQRGVISLDVSFAMPQPELPVVERPASDAPVIVTPQRALIQQRRYLATTTTGADLSSEVPLESSLEPQPRSLERAQTDSRSDDLAPALEPGVVPRASRTAMPQVAGLEQGPDFADNAPPEFPELARQNGWYGTVLLRLWIDADGRVAEVRVHESSGYGVLDAAAFTAVKRWRGKPARQNGRPVPTEQLLPVVFRPRLSRDP